MEQSGQINILLVDDRPDGLLALEAILRDPEYNLVSAASGEEALLRLMEMEFVVILLDVQMPGMDGFETASLIKQQERYRAIPIIFVTGIHGDVRFMNQGYGIGAIDYVSKPFEPCVLRSKVAVLVDLHRKTRLLQELQRREHERELAETKRMLEEQYLVRERRLISLVENSSDFIAIFTPAERIIYLNKAGRELVGLEKEEEALSKSILDFFSEEERSRIEASLFPSVLRDGEWEHELCLRHFRSGELIPVWSRGFLIRDPKGGGIEAIATVSRDLTERKVAEQALRESEQRFRTLAGCAPVGILFADSGRRCQYVNARWQEMTGLSFGEAQDDGWLQALHPDDRERAKRSWERVALGGAPVPSQLRLLRPSGEVMWVQWHLSAMRNELGGVTGFVSTCMDVTERIKSERAMKQVADELTRSNEELQQFAWIASHDLQEPLRMVSSFVRLLELKYKDKLDSQAQEYINFAVDGAVRMHHLVHDLLAYSRLGERIDPVREVDCKALFETAVRNLQMAIDESGAIVTCESLPSLKIDSTHLGQLFQNLIGNAIKFRGSKPPRVHVAAKKNRDEWVFSIRDNGIGIEPQYRDRIFVIFQRLHRKEFSGTGIGLAICKKIVEKHGGRIWVESSPGEGATFYFSIPADAKKEPSTETAACPSPRRHPLLT